MAIASNYNASGLASGIDWTTMVDSLVKLESQPIDSLRTRQQALQTQVSQLGMLASKVAALRSAADDLSGSGALAVKVAGALSSFAAEPGSGASAGRYQLQVTALAQAAKARSAGFAATDSLAAGTLDLSVQGKSYTVTMTDGESLSDVAASIRASGAPLSATVLDDGTRKWLTLTDRDTGFAIGSDPSSALSVSETTTGSGQALGIATVQAAQNAQLTLDGISLTRQSNVIADAVPGTTLTLTRSGGPAEDLVLENDVASTATNVQKFVAAYNDVIQLVQAELAVDKTTDRQSTLAGDGTVRSLQRALQGLLISKVGAGSVRALADLGIATARDGSLSLDQDALANAISRDPEAVNQLFTDQTSGLGALADSLANTYTNSADGLLVTRQSSLNRTVRDMDTQAADLQKRVDDYRQRLLAQFTAMESTISSFKAIGQYLTQQEATSKSS